jgi:hypothetical protein
MIIDEDGAQSTNVAGTSFAAGQGRYNLPPLAYAKPNQRISTNDMIAYLAEEAPKNGERFELSATAVNPRWFPVVATASKGELLNGITNRSGNSRLHNAIQCVTCLFKNVSETGRPGAGKRPFRNEAVTTRSSLVNFNYLYQSDDNAVRISRFSKPERYRASLAFSECDALKASFEYETEKRKQIVKQYWPSYGL